MFLFFQEANVKLRQELSKTKQAYSDALNRLAKKEEELNLKKTELADMQTLGSQGSDEVLLQELTLVKARLAHKTQLLDKVKVLLTRAAAKERVLREQVIIEI